MKKYRFVVFLLALLISVNAYAKTVGFCCVQDTNALVESKQLTAALETALFDVCFDSGLVATNVAYDIHGYEGYENNFLSNKALASTIDYLTIVYCEYESNKASSSPEKSVDWNNIYCKLIDFTSERTVFEKKIPVALHQNKDALMQAYSMGQLIGKMVIQEVLNNSKAPAKNLVGFLEDASSAKLITSNSISLYKIDTYGITSQKSSRKTGEQSSPQKTVSQSALADMILTSLQNKPIGLSFSRFPQMDTNAALL
ncbi:MAG: hypothetical protein ACTTJ7_08890 [Treponema sp.]